MPTAKAIRVLVVDDSPVVRKVVAGMLQEDPSFLVVGEAIDGADALLKINEVSPDVMLLDLQMPKKDGFEVLEELHEKEARAVSSEDTLRLPRVVVFSSLIGEDQDIALKTLSLGAVSCLGKPERGILHIDELKPRIISALKEAYIARHPESFNSSSRSVKPKTLHAAEIVMIGSSTGGPSVLEEIVPLLPDTLRFPLVVIQHLPGLFTKSLAQRLARLGKLPMMEAQEGDRLMPSKGYIAPGGKNIGVRGGKVYIDNASTSKIKPSIDFFFTSAAKMYGNRCVAVFLSGMDGEGVEGAKAVREAGGLIIVQDPRTCMIDAMPKAVISRELVDEILAPKGIVERLIELGSRMQELRTKK